MYPHRPSIVRPVALSVGVALVLATAFAPPASAAATPSVNTSKASTKKTSTKKKMGSTSKPAKRKPAAHRRTKRAMQLGSGDGYRALAALEPYAGPTGVVLHTRGYTTRFKLSDDPQNEAGFNDEQERWVEIGGGSRTREKTTWFDYDGSVDSVNDAWRDPRFQTIVSNRWPASVAIWCSPHPNEASEADLLRRLGAAKDLPAGPVINGVATTVLTVPVDFGTDAPGTPPTFRYYLNASTKVPVRSTYTPHEARSPLAQTDYSLWEVLPAGGSAKDLAGSLPLDADLGQGDGARPGCIGQ